MMSSATCVVVAEEALAVRIVVGLTFWFSRIATAATATRKKTATSITVSANLLLGFCLFEVSMRVSPVPVALSINRVLLSLAPSLAGLPTSPCDALAETLLG
jgi:hypothetical protein